MSGLPVLDWPAWRDTAIALQLRTQIVGKIRLTLTPWLNHGWHVALYVTPIGLTTSAIPWDEGSFEIDFDFQADRVSVVRSTGQRASVALTAGTIADFYRDLMQALADIGVRVAISTMPNEMADPVAFPEDHRERPYDGDAVRRFHAALCFADDAFKQFRSGFLGKASPVHFFWGSFDLAVTRFSGGGAPPHPGGVPGLPDAVTREAYSHEVSSAGFWPGSDAFAEAAFYSYAYPAHDGFADARVKPSAARFHAGLGEFVLPYEAVQAAQDPRAMLLDFLQSTYDAAADLGGWDREALECPLGIPGRPRFV